MPLAAYPLVLDTKIHAKFSFSNNFKITSFEKAEDKLYNNNAEEENTHEQDPNDDINIVDTEYNYNDQDIDIDYADQANINQTVQALDLEGGGSRYDKLIILHK